MARKVLEFGLLLGAVALWYVVCVESYCLPNFEESCAVNLSLKLYPESFMVFGGYEGRIFTVGNVVILVAKFPDSVCSVPDPAILHSSCRPYITVRMRTNDGNCLDVPAESTALLENHFGFSFSEDPLLETNSEFYRHWAFPLYVVPGMSTSRLSLIGMTIPEECNSEYGTFENENLIKESISLRPTVRIDTQTATIVSLHTGKASGRYTLGTTINIVLEFDKDVVLSGLPDRYSDTYVNEDGAQKIPYGVPYLELNSNALVPLRGYDSVKSKRKISFLYQVGPGEETPPGEPLDVVAGTGIELNGGTILAEGTGLDVNMSSMPLPTAEGSLSHPTANKIFIYKTGEKFPPLKYESDVNPDAVETGAERRRAANGDAQITRKTAKPTVVTTELRVVSILDVDEGLQQFQADFVLTSRWTDRRLRNPDAPAVVDYDGSVLESGRIWSPRLRVANRRASAAARDGTRAETSVQVFNSGRVVAVQREVATLGADMDLRDFPFDVQTLRLLVVPELPRDAVRLRASSREAQANASAALRRVANPRFALDNHREEVSSVDSGSPQRSFDALTVTFRAARISTFATMMLVAPACLLCALACLAVTLDPAGDVRLVVPAAAATATMGLSCLLAAECPPLGYPTRLHLLYFFVYALAAVQTAAAAYQRAVCQALRRLAEHSARARRAAKDAEWLAAAAARGGGDCEDGGDGGTDVWPAVAGSAATKLEKAASNVGKVAPRRAKGGGGCSGGGGGGGGQCLLDQALVVSVPFLAAAGGTDDAVSATTTRDEGRWADWGSGPVGLFWGLAVVTSDNAGAWEAHVRRVDLVLWGSMPVVALAAVLFILLGGVVVSGHPGAHAPVWQGQLTGGF